MKIHSEILFVMVMYYICYLSSQT